MLAIELFETRLNPKNPYDDFYAKMKTLQDLELDPQVDPNAVKQRKLDLKREFEKLNEDWKKTVVGTLIGLLMVGNVGADQATRDAISIARKANAMKGYNLEALEGEAKQELFNILRTINGHPNQSKLWPVIKDIISSPDEQKLPPLQEPR